MAFFYQEKRCCTVACRYYCTSSTAVALHINNINTSIVGPAVRLEIEGPDQIRSDQIKSDQIARSDQIRSNQIR